MSNITTTHAASGLVRSRLASRERVSEHVVRVTLEGDDFARFQGLGFDQWFRLLLPQQDETVFDRVHDRIDFKGYLKYLLISQSTRPAIRNYTVREFRQAQRQLDIDVIVHGDAGIAGPWARDAQIGAPVALIDQGCGYAPPASTDWQLLVADETGMPAIVGILRDLPKTARGHAIVEIPSHGDAQPVELPSGFTLDWVTRPNGTRPGETALQAARETRLEGSTPYAFAVGESQLATGVRRHLVRDLAVPKTQVTFAGYWKLGRSDAAHA
ncbi:siderophore-interacting protein [Pseudoclavibacter sp. RFBG4]|uniref:siderophore-interacting protein n=1 Tax=Pseudoclavibacter sp. RFBG4 TaxID=2080575 RepID=UPI000CE80F1B|nr:siderophore-interacting protein [Pseudoclavibacter sp. RFBG4]PPG27777.1 siderophore-interacting protein [Pseudoclavibacter sp. RFBG4]